MNGMVTIIDLADDSSNEVTTLIDVEDNNKEDSVQSDVNKLFEKCFECCKHADESREMVQVVNRMVIPAYKQLNENYKKSKSFEKVLKRTLQVLQIDPSHKFTHIRDLYETMKLHKVRKKVNFVTIERNITDVNTKRKTDSNDNVIKKCKKYVIELDDDSTQVIDLENNESDVIVLDDGKIEDDEKENNSDNEGANLHHIKNIKSNKSICSMISELVTNEVNNSKLNDSNMDEENNFLVPRIAVPFVEDNKQSDLKRISIIERKIAIYKKKIAYLDEQEVECDNTSSPYIMSEKYKAKIVELYRELCELTGTDSVKHCEVRLSVKDGHSAGPVRRLERKLNQGIGSSGEPNFPDFNDVVKCVIASNELDALGWNKAQIMREATSLFTQCGRALQKRRQEREWRHLMAKVKQEQFEVDPAENDPELEARLEENRRIAMRKEADILERFTRMQDSKPCDVNNKLNVQIQNGSEESVNASPESEKQSSKSIKKETTEKIAYEIEHCANDDDDDEVIIKREPVEDLIELLENLDENYTTNVIEIEDPSLVIEISSDSCSDEE